MSLIDVCRGDISAARADAIVSSTKEQLRIDGGVHAAAGPMLPRRRDVRGGDSLQHVGRPAGGAPCHPHRAAALAGGRARAARRDLPGSARVPCHRSWTGFEIFSFRIRERPGGALLDQLQVCDDRERFTVADDARALEQAEWLIDWLGSAKAR